MSSVKFSKDQIQKIMLSVILLIMFTVAYYTFLLKPLSTKTATARTEIAALETKIRQADSQIKRTAQLQEQSVAASETLAHFTGNIPDGSPIAWFPLRMASFFKRYNLEGLATRQLNTTPVGESLPLWSQLNWTIDIPQANFIDAATALAALENEELLMNITKLNIATKEQDPEFQQVSFEATILLNK